jgi:hypothetical protein
VENLTGVARVTLKGELDPRVDLRPTDLRGDAPWLDGLQVRAGQLNPGYDLKLLSSEPTVRGQFVRDVQAANLSSEESRRVLLTGLRALDGRDDLEVA